ncbi:hypothetical protein MNB_SV-12-1563 [hydrothermal vent metagenome]|uniref:Uncharacterized protein n=1 Tax=hydrothermal vent metagenome TaxID=652676 RepID=A0A1W1BYP3_9ZZZZ
MHIKQETTTLIKIQSNFKNLLDLEDEVFLSKLKEISRA